MKRILAVTLGLVLFVAGAFELRFEAASQAAAGWTTLFDGSNLNNFNPIGTANWRIAEGAVEANMGTGFLVTKASYGDFEFRAEIWVNPEANSGVFIRCSNPKDVTAMNAYEVNIFDMRPDPAYRTGAIVNVAKPASMVNAGNRWNTLEIGAKGPRLTVRLNGMSMVDVEDKKFASGPIALQYGAGIVKFRNVQIR